MYKYCLKAPAGFPKQYIHLSASDKGILSLYFFDHALTEQNKNPIIEMCIDELNRYFARELIVFKTPVDLIGTDF